MMRACLLLLLLLNVKQCLAQGVDSYVHEKGKRLSLAEMKTLCENRAIKKLDLRGAGLSDRVIAPLAKATWLEELRIDSHTLTSDGYAALKDLKQLKILGIQSLSSPAEISTAFRLIKDFALEELDVSNSSSLTGERLKILNFAKTLKVLDVSCGRGGMTDAGLLELAKFTELRSLDLNGHGGPKLGLKALSGLRKLEKLNLYGCRGLKDEAFTVFFEKMKNLNDLNMGFCWLHKGEGLVFPASVESLNLVESKQLTDAAFESFSCRDSVRHLNLFQCLSLTDKGVLRLGYLQKIETLSVGCIRALTNESLKSIGRNVTLRELNICDNDLFSDEGILLLKNLRAMEVLNLWHLKGLTGSGLVVLSGMPKLRELNLADCHHLTDGGLHYVKNAKSIESLYLDQCRTITDAGITKLAGNVTLKELTLQGCPNLTDKTLESVSTMRGLRYLDIRNCLKMTDEGRREIQQALPNCLILM